MAKPQSPPKPKAKRTAKARVKQDTDAVETAEVLDEDEIFKTFFTKYALDVIALIKPDLYAQIDLSVPIEFCEQELINFLRGRLRQVDKRKVADKLLRLKLLNGKDHYVFFHNEFQNDLLDELAFRWFKSRMLIALRYNVEDITTLIIFTGKPPLKKHYLYELDCFGTRTTFKPNIFVVANQVERKLIASDNPTALAFLAAKYAAQSKGNPKKMYRLKKKILDLVKKKWSNTPELESIVNFVFDYMLLPKEMEAQLIEETPILQPLKSDTMIISANRKMIRDAICLEATGMTFDEYRVDSTAKLEAQSAETEAAVKAAKAAEAAAAEAAEIAAEIAAEAAKTETNLIATHNMLKLNFSVETIAGILELDMDTVEKLIKKGI